MMRVPENSTWNKLEHGLDEAAKTAKVKICEKAVAEKAKQIPSRSKNRERNTKQRRARPSSPSITSLLQCLPCNGLSMSCPWLFRSKKLFTSNPSKPSHPPSSPPLPARQHTPSSHPGTTLIHSRPMPTPPLNTDHWESNRQAALPRVASNTFGRPPPPSGSGPGSANCVLHFSGSSNNSKLSWLDGLASAAPNCGSPVTVGEGEEAEDG